jgi:hypothetical protein
MCLPNARFSWNHGHPSGHIPSHQVSRPGQEAEARECFRWRRSVAAMPLLLRPPWNPTRRATGACGLAEQPHYSARAFRW